jgi:uncharacterized membrane protein YeaQ/YmgE (transglycosylase-associated protein family)
MITGIMRARKNGEAITAAGFKMTFDKFTVYNIGIITGFILENYLLGPTIPFVKILAGLIGATEGKSIFENVNAVSGIDIFGKIKTFFKSDKN